MIFLDERQKSFPVSLPWGKAPDTAEINSTDGWILAHVLCYFDSLGNSITRWNENVVLSPCKLNYDKSRLN